jgi:hypothetical protein
MLIEDKIEIIQEAENGNLGLRIRMRVKRESFTEYLETDNIYLETYSEDGNVVDAVLIKVKLIKELISKIKVFIKKNPENKIVKVSIVK